MNKPPFNFLQSGQRAIEKEAAAVEALHRRLNADFNSACQLLMTCEGRVVVTGMGKSGHVGSKIAATLASTGTPAFFVHPGEASHGDFGMITPKDVVIAISNSGNVSELLTLLPMLKRLGVPLISLCGNAKSPLSRAANVNLDTSVEEEACPLDLAPTSSTTVTLVMGDALAIALLEARDFTAEDFAFAHPGGTLGRKLLLKVEDLIHRGSAIPIVGEHTPLLEVLSLMSKKMFGMTCVCNKAGKLVGVFTDGDLRRCLSQKIDITSSHIDAVMNVQPQTIHKEALAAEALRIMEARRISVLVTLNAEQQPDGILHMHDLLHAGIA